MRSARRIVVVATWLIAGTGVALAQGDRSRVIGVLSDPAGAGLAGVEVVLSGIDVRDTYTARTDGEGRYDFSRVAPGGYRVDVRYPDIVPLAETLAVAAGKSLKSDIGTALRVEIGLALRGVSADAVRRWVSGGQPPPGPIEWECTSTGGGFAAPGRKTQGRACEAGFRRPGGMATLGPPSP